MAIERILLIGHCGFDASQLRAAVEDAAGDVPVAEARSLDEVQRAGGGTLLLINRQLGYGFGTSSGVDLIRELGQKPDAPVMMLISNYDDAQRAAVDVGARPGFGKGELGTSAMRQRLRDAIAGVTSG